MRRPLRIETEGTGRTALASFDSATASLRASKESGPAPAMPPAPGLGPNLNTSRWARHDRRSLLADPIAGAASLVRAVGLGAAVYLLGALVQIGLGAIGVPPA